MTKRPFLVEFIGTPEAGKTTTLLACNKRLMAAGYSTHRVQESAEILPSELPKGSWHAHLYMHSLSFVKVIHSLYLPRDIVLIDRGLYDSRFWGGLYLKKGGCSKQQYTSYMAMYENLDFDSDLVIALTTTPKEAIRRRGGEGRIVTLDFVKAYNDHFFDFYETINVRKMIMDTTNFSIEQVVSEVLVNILHYYQKHNTP